MGGLLIQDIWFSFYHSVLLEFKKKRDFMYLIERESKERGRGRRRGRSRLPTEQRTRS